MNTYGTCTTGNVSFYGDYGGLYTASTPLTVTASTPLASFSFDTSGDPQVDFDASASSTIFGTIAKYDWNFVESNPGPIANPATSYTFTTNGSFSVTLEVKNSDGCKKTNSQNVTITGNS